MKVVVIGGSGHIGRFLVPMLVEAGHEPIVVVRGQTALPADPRWANARVVEGDASNTDSLRPLVAEKPQVVIDIPGTARITYQLFHETAQHMIAVGSLWMYGEPRTVPTPELTQAPCVFEGYARRYAELRQMLAIGAADGMAVTAVMPPNICGPGKIPLDCLGGRDLAVHRAHAAGHEVVLPDGPEALVAPCDAEDIARCMLLALTHREQAAGQMFNVGAGYALTWTEFVAAYSEIYGVAIPIRRVSWQQYSETISPGIGYWWHMKAHMCPDISKAQQLLGYTPHYPPCETMARAVAWMREEKLL